MVQNGKNSRNRVNAALNDESRRMQENNREYLKMVFRKIKFLAGQGLTCIGKPDEERNFKEDLNTIIESHNKECDFCENYDYASDLVKNEIIKLHHNDAMKKLMKQMVENDLFFSARMKR